MNGRHRIRPPRPEDPMFLMARGPRFASSVTQILVSFGLVLAGVAVVVVAINHFAGGLIQ